MRPSQSNPNSNSPLENQPYLNDDQSFTINLDHPDELNEMHQVLPHEMYSHNAFENFYSSNIIENLREPPLSLQRIHSQSPSEPSNKNLSAETFIPNLEEKQDDFSLSYVVALGRNLGSMANKDRNRNFTSNVDNYNSRQVSQPQDYHSTPLSYSSRSHTNLVIKEPKQESTRKRSYSSMSKDISLDREPFRFPNTCIETSHKKWQEWLARSKRARNVQDDEESQHPNSSTDQEYYPSLESYFVALEKDKAQCK